MADKKDLTSYKKFTSRRHKTAIVETVAGDKFEIHSLEPGDFLALMGVPIISKFIKAAGVTDTSDQEDMMKAIDLLTPEKQMEMVTDPNFMLMVKKAVCACVTSINFVDKPQDRCDEDKEEASVSLLTPREMFEIYAAAMELSLSEGEAKDFYSFREKDAEEQGMDDNTAPDGEELRAATVGDTVPQQQ